MADRPKRNIAYYLERRLRELPLAGRVAVDVPAGRGATSALMTRLGAQVEALDLFPETFAVEGLDCRFADLGERLPLEPSAADLVVCQEGIEHLADQLKALREFNRALKPDGRLLITTPNVSHLRARVSHLFNESDLYSRLPPTEADSIWFSRGGSEIYFGHIFLMGVQQLRVLGRIAGFRIERVNFTRPSWGSVLFGFLYPVMLVTNLLGYWHSLRRSKGLSEAWKKEVYRDTLRLNLDPKVLFGKYLFVELVKEREVEVTAGHFHDLSRGEWDISATRAHEIPRPEVSAESEPAPASPQESVPVD